MLNNLQVTAYMSSPFGTTDNWSPNLDALLYWLWLEERGLNNPNANADNYIKAEIPIAEKTIKDISFYAVSSPIYKVQSVQTTRYRKRWDNQDKHLDWGKKKAKVDTSEGQFKNWDLPLRLVDTKRIDWYCVGDKAEISRLLTKCTNIGKKRSQGKGQVLRWHVQEIEEDRSVLWQGKIMRPLPATVIPTLFDVVGSHDVMYWAYHPPYFLPQNKDYCAMPDLLIR